MRANKRFHHGSDGLGAIPEPQELHDKLTAEMLGLRTFVVTVALSLGLAFCAVE